nr:MAG TPA: hypothetical protein [Caudoviricetes sp.]
MRTPVALMQYVVTAPVDEAAEIVAQAAASGNPIEVVIANKDGWMVMRMNLAPIASGRGTTNSWSLIASKARPKQLFVATGSHGQYLQRLRARVHTWLQGGGTPVLAAKRLAEYQGMEMSASDADHPWGSPRAGGRKQRDGGEPDHTPRGRGKRGSDRTRRRPRRDLYVVYTSPFGEQLMIRGHSAVARDILENGAYVPNGWTCHKAYTIGAMDKRPLLVRLLAMKSGSVNDEISKGLLCKFLKGDCFSTSRQPVTFKAKA